MGERWARRYAIFQEALAPVWQRVAGVRTPLAIFADAFAASVPEAERLNRMEARMTYPLRTLLALASIVAVPAVAQQTPEAQCSTSATQATGYVPGTESGPSGNRIRGAAAGAAAGATVGAVQNNNRYDNAPQALKDEHRHNQARTGAAAGMVAGGSRNRQDRRENRRNEDTWQKSYNACLQQQGAPVK